MEEGDSGRVTTAAGDDKLKQIFNGIRTSKSPAVINYGASCVIVFYGVPAAYVHLTACSSCRVCSQVLPAYFQLSKKFPKLSFFYADIDECPEATQHIRYTPTFHFYRDGERVDEMFGAGEERLHDRLWLHS